MNKQWLAFTATLTLVVSGSALASDIYKWVDEDGNVHYGDKPIVTTAERVGIESQPTTAASIAAQNEALAASNERRASARATASEDDAATAELQAQAAERQKKCSEYRANLQRMNEARRLYREGDTGERVYLDDAEMQAARQRVEREVNEFCSS